MNELRNSLYNQIEVLENKMKEFPTNEYGFSSDPECIEIREKIGSLESRISETWIR